MSAGAFRLRQHAAAAVARLGLLVSGCAMLAGCYPLINDISTDRAQPPRYLVAPPADPAYDAGALAERTATAYPDLRNLLLPADPPAVFAAVAALAAAQGWQEAAREAGDAQRPWRFQAIASTPVLRFKDDVLVEVRPHPGGSEVAMRSKSRVGKGDLGANAKRIRAFLAALRTRVPAAVQ